MRLTYFFAFIIITGLTTTNSVSQNTLTSDDAVGMALENNFGILLAENASELAKNNTSKFNSGKLPTVSLDGGGNFNLDNTNVNFQNGTSTKLTAATSYGANASVNVGYTLYDGMIRSQTMDQLQLRFQLTELETQAVMENVVAQALSQYYQAASLSSTLGIISETITVSNQRLTRASERFEFGQANGLDISNAEVDLNNDSLNWVNANLLLENAKRQLNNIIIDQDNIEYIVDTTVSFISGLSKDDLKSSMLENHISIQQSDRNIEIGNMNIDLAEARKLPTVGTSLSYGFNYNNNNSASFASSVSGNGLSVGLTFKWNIFDGGARRVAEEAATINARGLQVQKEQLINDLSFDFEQAWASYQNSLYIYRFEQNNVEINRKNFNRTQERFKIGQINSVDFRQAQLNLLSAQTNTNAAKYQVKLAEVELLLLSGRILSTN